MTDAAFLYHCLEDGKWHGQAEILRRSEEERGHGMTVHSRAADLRKRGCEVQCEVRHNGHGRPLSYYRMVVALNESAEAAAVGTVSSSAGSLSVPAALPAAEPSEADTLTLFGLPVWRLWRRRVNAVTSLDEYRAQNGIKHLLGQAWPSSRREFLADRREQADLGLRVTICGFCGAESPLLDGPCGRAWFAAHNCEVKQ